MEQERCKISVIVSVYNKEPYLKRSIESLLAQTYRNLEILLIDDGSQDRSGDICDALAKQDSRIRVFHKENGGVYSAWTRGVRESVGEYLNFMDSDDWVDPEMLEEMAKHLLGGRKEIVACDYVIERSGGRQQFVWQKLLPGEYEGERLRREIAPALLGEEERLVSFSKCMKLISRELICGNITFCDPRVGMGDDTLIIVPALLDCERLVILDHKAYYHYLYLESSLVHHYDRNLYENMRWLRAAVERIVREKYGPEEQAAMLRRADREFLLMLLLVLKNEARGNPRGYRKNIRAIGCDPEVSALVNAVPLEIRTASNRLLYAVLKHPDFVMLSLLRFAMVLYYVRQR